MAVDPHVFLPLSRAFEETWSQPNESKHSQKLLTSPGLDTNYTQFMGPVAVPLDDVLLGRAARPFLASPPPVPWEAPAVLAPQFPPSAESLDLPTAVLGKSLSEHPSESVQQ